MIDLKYEFPDRDLSPRNLLDMKRFYDCYHLPWGYNLPLSNKVQSLPAVEFYAAEAVAKGWLRDLWLNFRQLALLFGRDVKTIGKHINTIFTEGELIKEVAVAKFATTTLHGAIKDKTQTQQVEYYNLDVIISVGYSVKSKQGTQFNTWGHNLLLSKNNKLQNLILKEINAADENE